MQSVKTILRLERKELTTCWQRPGGDGDKREAMSDDQIEERHYGPRPSRPPSVQAVGMRLVRHGYGTRSTGPVRSVRYGYEKEKEAEAPEKNCRLCAREQLDESKAKRDLNAHIKQLMNLILTSQTVDENHRDELRPASPFGVSYGSYSGS
ncbi:hypothetical protein V8E52_007474 [Russula decolorans]